MLKVSKKKAAVIALAEEHFAELYENRKDHIRAMMVTDPKAILEIIFVTGFLGGKEMFEGVIDCTCDNCKQLKELQGA